MKYAVYNPNTEKFFGIYDSDCPRNAKLSKYNEDGIKDNEVSEAMLQRLDANPIPCYNNEDRISLSQFP